MMLSLSPPPPKKIKNKKKLLWSSSYLKFILGKAHLILDKANQTNPTPMILTNA